jgi:hypothetical protein
LVQLFNDVAVTVYVVVALGVWVSTAPDALPAAHDHEYVFAPDAVSVILCPTQMDVAGDDVIATVGIGFTRMLTLLLLVPHSLVT